MEPQEPTEQVTKKKLLIAEDNAVLGEMYQRRFELEGFEVRLVAEGTQVESTVVEFQPDLVLLDLMMPGQNGLSVLEGIRKNPETLKIKVFVFSALDQATDKERAMRLGANEYLVKSKDMLMDVIDRVKQEFGMPIAPRPTDDSEI